MKSLTDLIKAFKQTRSATQGFVESITDIRGGISELDARVEKVERGLLTREEAIERIRRLAADKAEYFMLRRGRSIANMLLSPDADSLDQLDDRDLAGFDARCALDTEQIVAALTALIDREPHEAGLPMAERPAAVASLLRDRDKLAAVEEDAIDRAASDGVVVQHRTEVIERRAQAARVVDVSEQSVADRRKRQAEIDLIPKTPTVNPEAVRRTGDSRYLKTGRV